MIPKCHLDAKISRFLSLWVSGTSIQCMKEEKSREQGRKLIRSDYSQSNIPQAESKLSNMICGAA